MQGLRAKHHVHKGRTFDDLCAFLAGHTTAYANQYAFFGQVAHAAQVRKNFLLRLFAHRAGVEQNEVGLVHVLRRGVTLGGTQHVSHLVRVVLVHLAAKGFDEYFFAVGHTDLSVECYKFYSCICSINGGYSPVLLGSNQPGVPRSVYLGSVDARVLDLEPMPSVAVFASDT